MLRKETVEQATLELLKKLTLLPELSQFRLVGGTALSLLVGHRKSIDLDLLSDQPFDRPFLKEILEDLFHAVLKLNAIKGRGSKKDFWDIAKLLDTYPLEKLLSFYEKRYPYDDTFAVIRSLVYFDDAETDPDPIMVEPTSWDRVKKTIEKAFKDYYKTK